MTARKNLANRSNWLLVIEIVCIAALTTLAYLPNLSRATVYRDDWYYILDRTKGGPDIFQQMFSVDRPARGPFFEIYYQLFGILPAPYHLASFIWRLLGGVCAGWLFRLLWPQQRWATFCMTVLFALYPGYFKWMEGFENQPQIASLFFQTVSIALTLQAIRDRRLSFKIWLWLGSILAGWIYLALVDFAIGMEFFRILCVFLLINRNQDSFPLVIKTAVAVRAWLPTILIPAGFLLWRFLLFHNTRPETDFGLQMGILLASPGLRGAWWLIYLFQSVVNTIFLAWAAPLFQVFFEMRLKTAGIGLGLALAAGAGVLIAAFFTHKLMPVLQSPGEANEAEPRWQLEAMGIGLAGVVIGVFPIIMANRFVTFERYSHYALPASLAAVAFMAGLVFSLRSRWLKTVAVMGLVMAAVLTHYTASAQVLQEEQTINAFWHQIAWRAPGIQEGTALLVYYPEVDYSEDVDAVAGPANYIYFPQYTGQIPVKYSLAPLSQMPWTVHDLQTGGVFPGGYRTHSWVVDYNQVLVITQPARNSCARVINPQWPWFSYQDRDWIVLAGASSKPDLILTAPGLINLPGFIFGAEPAHEWCYYFEKAELAVQMGAWEKVAELGVQALVHDFRPVERLEWMPFLQAYATLGDVDAFSITASYMTETVFNRHQTCSVLRAMQKNGFTFNPGILEKIDQSICLGTYP